MRPRSLLSRLTSGAALFALASPLAQAQVQNLAFWNFNDGTANAGQIDQSVRDALMSVDGGLNAATGLMSTNFDTRDAASNLADGINSFTGTNLLGTPPGGVAAGAGQALGLQGGIQNFPNDATNTPNNGRLLTFSVSTAGFKNITVAFAARGTAAGFVNDQFQVSTDGATFTNFSSAYSPQSTTFFGKIFDLSGVAGLEDNPLAAFRIRFDGATSLLGNNRIDNLQINGVSINATGAPEPASGALFALTAAVVGWRPFHRRRPL